VVINAGWICTGSNTNGTTGSGRIPLFWAFRLAAGLLLATVALLSADDRPVPAGLGVNPPRVLSKTNPRYTREAEGALIQGTVIYQLVVDKSGHPRDIRVLSPIGYGLDELGEQAIRKWTFAPGMKDGQAVNVPAQVEINFRFPGKSFDRRQEEQRTAYNLAIHDITNQGKQEKARATIRRLAEDKYTPAVYLLGSWTLNGESVTQDAPRGVALISKAAEKNFGPAVFELGLLYDTGEYVPKDAVRGMKMIRQASMLGSVGAQVELGERYEAGREVDADPERARYYFRLCAAQGIGKCEFHLGRLLLERPGGGYSDSVQAAAWLDLAAENRIAGAEEAASEAAGILDAEQTAQMKRLKGQLVRNRH
jgi:TonB family protein